MSYLAQLCTDPLKYCVLLDRELKEALTRDDAPRYRPLANFRRACVGDIEEVVVNLQGYLLHASLLPMHQHNLPRNQNHIDLKQSVTLTGLASQQFHAGVCGAVAVVIFVLGRQALTGESLTLSFSNRILTPAKDAEGEQEYSLEHIVDPFNILRPLLCSEVHTMENNVEYWTCTLCRRDNLKDSL
ncbi:hypothetical protein C8Q80DRAFT_1118255 [Daedaleopsis nitida]|nr:hypothetical protein C8Q80DRAFT_1118255 [Daedaleopsis nitida]